MVTYLTPTLAADPYSGQPAGDDWAEPVRTEAPSAFVLSSSTLDTSDGTNLTTSESWTLYVPEGEVEPGPRDRIEVDGQVFVMQGRPVRERNPFTGWAPYAQARLTRAEGKG